MNTVANSTSPSPRKPRERERVLDQRESLLRASILDTALELGVGSSSTVTNWIFNPVDEVDEDEDSMVSPSLTYASTATSEESSFSNSPFSRSQPGAGASPLGLYAGKALSPESAGYPNGSLSTRALTPEPPMNRTVQFDLSATPEPRIPSPLPPLRPQKPAKLQKPRPEGYDSDGGYMSEGSKSKKKDKKSKKKKKADGDQTEYESDGGYISESTSKKKKDKKRKKDKSKTSDYPGTDYESDAGYMSSRSISFGRKKSSKKSSTPADGDDSDGGYLSEATKKKRFFRFRKKQQESEPPIPDVPPVPQLPPVSLPIADRFIAKDSLDILDSADSRTATPAFSERTTTERGSDELSSSKESTFSMSIGSPKSLVNPFKDAESVRSPSIDVLATFHRRGILPGQFPGERSPGTGSPSPLNPSFSQMHSPSQSQTEPDPSSPSSFKVPIVPNLTIPKPKRNPSMKRTPPQISAPNTSSLSAKHTPLPLTITPPTPKSLSMLTDNPAMSSQSDRSSSPSPPLPSRTPELRSPFSPDPASVEDRDADVPHTPSTYTDNLSTAPPTPLLTRSPSPNPGSQGLQRPHVLAYYDLPPPSPPPSGPLPSVPGEAAANSPFARAQNAISPRNVSRPGTADSVPERMNPSPLRRPLPTAISTAPSSPFQSPPPRAMANAPPMSALSQQSFAPTPTTPSFMRSNQRGRDAPFPTQPVLPRQESAQLIRRTSRSGMRNTPMSADAASRNPSSFRPAGGSFEQARLDVNWQPRSASAMDVRDPSPDARWDGRRSWSEYDDEHGAGGSRASGETSAEVDAVISMLRAHRKDLDGRSTLALPSASGHGDSEDSRSTQYYELSDGEEGEEEEKIRYSVWSDSKSRASILDDETSGDVRERFVKRVEAMYGKEIIPPVPQLSVPPRSGMF